MNESVPKIGGAGDPPENPRMVTSNIRAWVYLMMAALAGCGSGTRNANGIDGSMNLGCRDLKVLALDRLGVGGEGRQTSLRDFDFDGNPLELIVGCACGEIGDVAGKARLEAHRAAALYLSDPESALILDSDATMEGKEVHCSGFVATDDNLR